MAVQALGRQEPSARPAECCPRIVSGDITAEEAKTAAVLFKALSDPKRVQIVNLLARSGEAICVCDLTDEVGLAQPTVSFHLKKLVGAGLLDRQQRGVWAYYSVNREALERLRDVFQRKEQADG